MDNIPDPRATVVAMLMDVEPHIRRISEAADDSIQLAVDRYVGAILDAQIRLRREVEGVQNG